MDPGDLNHGDPEADIDPVESRVTLLKQLVQQSLYVVDERAVADAIILRGDLDRPRPGQAIAPIAPDSGA